MGYRVFLSHSTRDRRLVTALSHILTKLGLNVFVAEWYLSPGERIAKKVFNALDKADCIVVLLTQNGVRSSWLHQEVGYALKSKKPVIPLVERGVSEPELGALGGIEYVAYDRELPEEALLRVSTYVKSLKLRKAEREKALLTAGGILAFLLLLTGEKR